jgi:hypothetical protein
MPVIDAGTKGGPHGHISVCRCIGDFGIPNLLRCGWCYWPKASSLNRGSLDSGFRKSDCQRVETAVAHAVNPRLVCKEF